MACPNCQAAIRWDSACNVSGSAQCDCCGENFRARELACELEDGVVWRPPKGTAITVHQGADGTITFRVTGPPLRQVRARAGPFSLVILLVSGLLALVTATLTLQAVIFLLEGNVISGLIFLMPCWLVIVLLGWMQQTITLGPDELVITKGWWPLRRRYLVACDEVRGVYVARPAPFGWDNLLPSRSPWNVAPTVQDKTRKIRFARHLVFEDKCRLAEVISAAVAKRRKEPL